MGGCAGTRYGCCSDQITPKQDEVGSNCPPECGKILYSTVGILPSNEPEKRVWNLSLAGTLQPHDGNYTILYDFSKVNYSEKDITFENILSGTFIICGHLLDAGKVADYEYCDTTSILKIILKQNGWGFRILRETNFFMNVMLDDAAGCAGTPCNSGVSTFTYNGTPTTQTYEIKEGDYVSVNVQGNTSSPTLTVSDVCQKSCSQACEISSTATPYSLSSTSTTVPINNSGTEVATATVSYDDNTVSICFSSP